MGIIYCITNLITNKKYIGIQMKNNQERWKDHIRHSKKNPSQLIDKKIAEYGLENFVYEEIFRTENINELKKKEQYFIKEFDTLVYNKKGYNLTSGGDGCVGFKMPFYKIHRGENHYLFGKHLSKEERNKRKMSMIGKNIGEKNGSKKPEVRLKISEKAKLRVGLLNPNYKHGRRIDGKYDSEYTKQYYQKNKDKIRKKAKERYTENREKELERAKKYRLTHKKIKYYWVRR
jgi:group I intron endonuclease